MGENEGVNLQEIDEGNKLIAEFMGGMYSKHAEAWGFGRAQVKPLKNFPDAIWAENWEKELKYDSLWDWLMPVVRKIEDLHLSVDICTGSVVIISRGTEDEDLLFMNIFMHIGEDVDEKEPNGKLRTLWRVIVKFIRWYNKARL